MRFVLPLSSAALLALAGAAAAQEPQAPAARNDDTPGAVKPPDAEAQAALMVKKDEKKEEHWYDKIKIRGYIQVRYNRVTKNDAIKNAQGDSSIGDNNGFIIRRLRPTIQGEYDWLAFVIQPDLVSSAGTQFHVAVVREAYADIFLDRAKEFRIRIGQSKLPFGFENMQSSMNRIALDRADGLNSAFKDERDIGAFFYWAPKHIRARFKAIADAGLKHSGDYGVIGLGAVNGQSANTREVNDNRTLVGRVAWPFDFGGQFVEVGAGAYSGRVVVSDCSTGVTGCPTNTPPRFFDYRDQRAQVYLSVFPQPLGLYAEYNIGRGPQLQFDETRRDFIDEHDLHGGHATITWRFQHTPVGEIWPYLRGSMYDGAKKFEVNAPAYHVRELEAGVEWQPSKWVEVTICGVTTNRSVPSTSLTSAPRSAQEKGELVRFQLQGNF